MAHDAITWRCHTTLRKYTADLAEYQRRYGLVEGERRFFCEQTPVEIREIDGNMLLQEGITAIFTLLTGGTATAFSAANARIGVGDSTTGASDVQTDLLGANKAYQAMDLTYPQVGAAATKKVTFRASFADGAANFAWQEWVVDNGSSAGITLNRKVQSLGTKAGGTWQLTVDISLS